MARFDDDAQVDGDESGSAQFFSRLSQAGTPWAREGLPPWHMWGNSETFGPMGAFSPDSVPILGRQLVRVSYKRPETWRWVFAARLIEAPSAGALGTYEMTIDFDVTIGLGRSSVTLPNFDRLKWTWTGTGNAPVGYPLWSTRTLSPPTEYSFVDGAPVADQTGREIDDLVAQDIQVSCRVQFVALDEPEGGQATLEVSGYFAPKTHIRPDWLQLDVPVESQFPGGEVGGK
jgi:hypothetical protein